ncbi:MAG TPA: hypothetical protein EYP89_02905 [Candidatus Omnitrophica bacterium]|nr:hypothetical protein [Candidatus Omnitrophota bacterium]
MGRYLKIGIIGFGNMGSALGETLKGKIKKIFVYDKDRKKTKNIKNLNVCENIKELMKNAKIITLAIKPQDVEKFLKENKKYFLNYQPLLI